MADSSPSLFLFSLGSLGSLGFSDSWLVHFPPNYSYYPRLLLAIIQVLRIAAMDDYVWFIELDAQKEFSWWGQRFLSYCTRLETWDLESWEDPEWSSSYTYCIVCVKYMQFGSSLMDVSPPVNAIHRQLVDLLWFDSMPRKWTSNTTRWLHWLLLPHFLQMTDQ